VRGENQPYTGYYLHFRNNGRLHVRGRLKQGYKDSIWKYCYKDGRVKAIESFKMGNPHGYWVEYNRIGEITSKRKFEDGRLVKSWDYDEIEQNLTEYEKKEPRAGKYSKYSRKTTARLKNPRVAEERETAETEPEPEKKSTPAKPSGVEEHLAPRPEDTAPETTAPVTEEAENDTRAEERVEAEDQEPRERKKKKKRTRREAEPPADNDDE
jgi:hypothetical protein